MSRWDTSAQRRQLADIRARGRRGAAAGLTKAVDMVLAESNKRVPVDKGDLRKSGKAKVDSAALKGQVSYSEYYAPFVHENLGDEHSGGQTAKFLENALNNLRPWIPRFVAASIDREVRR